MDDVQLEAGGTGTQNNSSSEAVLLLTVIPVCMARGMALEGIVYLNDTLDTEDLPKVQ